MQCDHMELLCHLESSSSLGSSYWGHIIVVVKDIFSLKINSPFDQLGKSGGEWKSWRKHDTWSWIFHEKGDTIYKIGLQEKGKIQVYLNFQWIQNKKTHRERKIHGAWEDGSSLLIWELELAITLHANLQLVAFQEGTNFLQHS